MLEIQKMISNYNYSSRNGSSIQYIVLHYTGNNSDTAKGNANYFNECDRNASAHYFVDENYIYQVIEDYNSAWAVGDGRGKYGINNRNSISIEMCCSGNYEISEITEDNTIELVKYLMNKYNIDIQHIVRHYDASYKTCPNWQYDNWTRWYRFKDKIINGNISDGKWILENNKWCYQCLDGTYPRDCWKKIDNKWYLFDESGWMLYDWKSDEGKWYYLGNSNDGSMKTGWLLKDNKWYYLDDTGSMSIGWRKILDKWYYFNQNGEMQTGWFKDNNKDYCTYFSGELITNCELYNYSFASNGEATPIVN